MDISALDEAQYAKLEEAVTNAMVAAAMATIEKQSFIRDYVYDHPNCSAADALKAALGSLPENYLKHRPFEFNDFLTSLEG